MPSAKQRYIRKLNAVAQRYGKLEDSTVRGILKMLKSLRSEIAGAVTAIDPTYWEAHRLTGLKAQINGLIDGFERSLRDEVDQALIAAGHLGRDAVDEPLAEIDSDAVQAYQARAVVQYFAPQPPQVQVAFDYTADLIQAITAPMRAQINRVLQLSLLGRLKPLDAMRQITQILGVEARTRVWAGRRDPIRGVAARAEADVRTELTRAYNLANHSHQRYVAEQHIPGLLKTWVAAADSRTRPSHLLAHIRYRHNPIPVTEPFVLSPSRGRRRGRQFRMMYPGDPSAPPELTINCRCKMATIHPTIGYIGSSLDGRIAGELNRRGVDWEREIVQETVRLVLPSKERVTENESRHRSFSVQHWPGPAGD